MVTLGSLWVPILVSAVLVFLVSSVIHMVLTYHRTDFHAVPAEDQVMEALRPFAIPPGDYVLPHAGTPAAMKSPEFIEKTKAGPVAMLTVLPGMPGIGKNLMQWFVYCLVVGVFAAYVASRTVEIGQGYLPVFRIVGTVAFACYGMALPQNSIWYSRSWNATAKSVFDSLIYGLVTAGTFGWLWPVGA